MSTAPLLGSSTAPNYLPDKLVAGTVVTVSFATAIYLTFGRDWWATAALTTTCVLSMALLGRIFYHDAQPVEELVGVTVQTADAASDLQLIAEKVSKIKHSLGLKTHSQDLATELDEVLQTVSSLLENIHTIQQSTIFDDEEVEELKPAMNALEQIAAYIQQAKAELAADDELIQSLQHTLSDSDQTIEELKQAIDEMKSSQNASPDQWSKVQSLLSQLTTRSSSASLPGTPSTPNVRKKKPFTGTPKRLDFDNM